MKSFRELSTRVVIFLLLNERENLKFINRQVSKVVLPTAPTMALGLGILRPRLRR